MPRLPKPLSAAVALAALALAAPTQASETDTGPALRVDAETLAAALACPDQFANPDREPVLLVHGTATTAHESWDHTYTPALAADGFDVCTVQLPERALGDIQLASEYVVHAVRTMATNSGGKVDVIGHSQGGLEPRWATRFWPDVQASVDDLVMLAAPNHGAASADALCPTSCAPAVQQMKTGSRLLAALNRDDETPGQIDYSSLYTANDELVQPVAPTPTAALDGAANVLVQDLCPGRPVHHVGIIHDAVVYDLVRAALAAPGPVDTTGFNRADCLKTWPSSMDPWRANFDVYGPAFAAFGSYQNNVEDEPALEPYAAG